MVFISISLSLYSSAKGPLAEGSTGGEILEKSSGMNSRFRASSEEELNVSECYQDLDKGGSRIPFSEHISMLRVDQMPPEL